jgi:5-hydroxyisourate hydrolase
MSISTHVLDTSLGKPANDIPVYLEIKKNNEWAQIESGITDIDGRVANFVSKTDKMDTGVYRITFETSEYYKSLNKESFYPETSIVFNVDSSTEHYHVPLLLSGFGYSTYRGS